MLEDLSDSQKGGWEKVEEMGEERDDIQSFAFK